MSYQGKIDESMYDEGHPTLISTYVKQGKILRALKKYREALDYLNRAWLGRGKNEGNKYATVATFYDDLGLTYAAMGDHQGAIENYEKALSIVEKEADLYRHLIGNYELNLGKAYLRLNEYVLAKEHLSAALKNNIEKWGDQHESVADTYENLGAVFYSEKKYSKSLYYIQKALMSN